MSLIPNKVMIFTVDSAVAPQVYEWARAGSLPTIGRLMEEGVHAINCLACYPTDTLPNRASLATGAWPGTHGLVDDVVPGKEMRGEPQPLDLDNSMAETIWKAAKRGGRRGVFRQWPSPWGLLDPQKSEQPPDKEHVSLEALLDLMDEQLARHLADTKKALAEPWDICFLALDLMDDFYRNWGWHAGRKSRGEVTFKPENANLLLFQRIDKALGELLEAAGNDTLVVVVSSHGAKPKGKTVNIGSILEQAGLLVYGPAADGEDRTIDWSRTKAVPWGSVHITVNLKGRNFNGIVEPGEEYEAVVQGIIDLLHGYTDPETGLKPISLAFRAEDMRILGLYGERIGDVVYALDPRYGPGFGSQLPASRFDGGDLRCLFVMSGPGVKKGEVLDRNIWLTDVAPTACYLAELPVPKDCEGCVIYQALERPDAKADELEALRVELSRLKLIVERPGMMC